MGSISIEEYRKVLNDYKTPNNIIEKRIKYLESFCRNIIKIELNKTAGHNTKENVGI